MIGCYSMINSQEYLRSISQFRTVTTTFPRKKKNNSNNNNNTTNTSFFSTGDEAVDRFVIQCEDSQNLLAAIQHPKCLVCITTLKKFQEANTYYLEQQKLAEQSQAESV